MALPEAKTLSREDFPDQSGWIDKLLRPLNSYISGSAYAFRNSLVLGENLQLTTVTIQTPGTVADAFPVYLDIQMRQRPRSCTIAYIEDKTNGNTFTTAVFPTWALSDSRVKIRHLTGLTTNNKYSVTFELKA